MRCLIAIVVLGCVGALPSLQSRHPVGYPRVVQVAPECATPTLASWASCDLGAGMLEGDAPAASMAFLARWDQAAFGEMEASRQSARDRSDVTGSIVYASVKADELAAMRRIALPVLRGIYDESPDPYAKAMRPHVGLIVLESPSSLAAYRMAHVNAMSPGAGP